MRGKKTERKGMKDVEGTKQATREGPSKRKQKQSKVNRINIKTLKLINYNELKLSYLCTCKSDD